MVAICSWMKLIKFVLNQLSENIQAVQKLIILDQCEIEATLEVSSTNIYKIHNLTKSQKDARVDWCKQIAVLQKACIRL